MENEAKEWVAKYDVPVFVCAVNDKKENISLQGERPINFLLSFKDSTTNLIKCYWEKLEDNQIPNVALDPAYLKKVYTDIPFRTNYDIAEQQAKRAKQNRIGWAIVFFWAVVVPAIIAILGWASPFVSALALIFSLYKAWDKGMKLSGKRKKSERDKEKTEKEKLMKHFYYHCIRNPQGFMKLKQENYAREAKDSIRQEVDKLKGK